MFALDAQASIYSPAIRHAMRDQPRSNVSSREARNAVGHAFGLDGLGHAPKHQKPHLGMLIRWGGFFAVRLPRDNN